VRLRVRYVSEGPAVTKKTEPTAGRKTPEPVKVTKCDHLCPVVTHDGHPCFNNCHKPQGHPGSHSCAQHDHPE
jgi:hypothetical protein